MKEELFRSVSGSGALEIDNVGRMIFRLSLAALLGATIAYRVWRKLLPRLSPPALESAQAQTLIAVAGALMVAVIGDSMARAFGLVGLGAFIRFRSGIKDPRDAAVMFVMIGIGMACGLGIPQVAVAATVFVAVVLAVFDTLGRARPRRTRVGITVEDPRGAFPAIGAAFPGARVLEMPNTNPEVGKVVLEAELLEDVDASSILKMLIDKNIPGIRNVVLDEGKV